MAALAADVVLLPLASEADAERTVRALRTTFSPDRVVLVHVVEKAGGAPDKASVEQREAFAADVFDVARDELADLDTDVETRILYGTDVPETVFETAADVDADLVVFSPREASRLSRFLSGDTALGLITDCDRPVLVLPGPGDSDE